MYMNIEITTNAHINDPLSSHLAGAEIESSGVASNQGSQCLAAVKLYQGLTSKEISEKTGLDRYMLARRLSEIGQLEQGAMKVCNVSKRLSVTWWLKKTN